MVKENRGHQRGEKGKKLNPWLLEKNRTELSVIH